MDWINPTTVISTITGIAAIATILIVVGKWIGKREEFERTAKETFADINEALAEIRADIKKICERLPVHGIHEEKPYQADGVRTNRIGLPEGIAVGIRNGQESKP